MNEELTKLIIKRLGKHHSRNEIIRTVCEESTLNWSEAEKLVDQVATEHASTISARQRPFLVFVSVGTLILGLALLFYNSQFFLGFFQKGIVEQLLGVQGGYYRLIGLVTGLGMVAGGFVGLGKSIWPLLEE